MNKDSSIEDFLDLRISYYQALAKDITVCDDGIYVGEVSGALEELYYIKEYLSKEK